MHAISSAASISIHAAVAAAFLLGTTKSARPSPAPSDPPRIVFPRETTRSLESNSDGGGGLPSVNVPREVGPIPVAPMPQTEASARPVVPPDWVPGDRGWGREPTGWPSVAETGPEVLAGPLPAYPDLLRQAGVAGQVVLEARVDTTGRVLRGSVVVVSATHPGFVEPARQALWATLFRPARVNGRAVSMLVRVPFAFSIRGGTGHAR